MLKSRLAFCGYAGVGKDCCAEPLYALGYERAAFGDIIKRQLDEVIKRHFGFSAFTEDRTQKALIRRTLESWGEDNYDAILTELMSSLPEKAVNTRLVRVREATEWKAVGGQLFEVIRPDIYPATDWERGRMAELRQSNLIDGIIVNDGTVQDLHDQVLRLR